MDNIFSEDITVSLNVTKVFGFLGFVALCLSTTGLFSLVSLNIQRRLKEIGVRKIHGQPTSGIMMTLHRNFLMIFLFACVTGTALGTFFTQALLSAIWVKFNPVSVLHIIQSIGVLSVVALATVFLRIYRASLVNPAEILKSE
jgi:ABC-type antimicrobial peptide transport system permease subunit